MPNMSDLKEQRMEAIEAGRKLKEIPLLRRDRTFGMILVAILQGIDEIESKLDSLIKKEE